VAHRSASTSLCGRARVSREKSPTPAPVPCSGHRLSAPIPAPTLHQEPPDGSPRAAPPLPLYRTAVGAHCASPSRDGRLRRRTTAAAVSCATLPPASSRHHRPDATTSICVHVMQRLPLPLGAKRLKPGESRQAASCDCKLCCHHLSKPLLLPTLMPCYVCACANAVRRCA
jgi:hypothetical protein